jgi:hypothetical protein
MPNYTRMPLLARFVETVSEPGKYHHDEGMGALPFRRSRNGRKRGEAGAGRGVGA